MSITRYEPFGLLTQLQRELARAEGSTATAEWSPSVDIKEEPDRFVIHADVPGVDPQDIDIHMENGQLTIKGEKKSEVTTDEKGYKRIERTHGSFYRRFGLPDSAEADQISARSKHGVLEIIIPKRESVQPRKISVVNEG